MCYLFWTPSLKYAIKSALPYAQIAQSVEQGTENPCVAGSIPALGTTFFMNTCGHGFQKCDAKVFLSRL